MISNFISRRESILNDNDDIIIENANLYQKNYPQETSHAQEREIQTAIISASKSLTSENVETLIFADQNGGKKLIILQIILSLKIAYNIDVNSLNNFKVCV